jgi:magnesium transporter
VATKVYLYDADGKDRETELEPDPITGLEEHQLLWIDMEDPAADELERVASILAIDPSSLRRSNPDHRPRLDNYGSYFRFSVDTAPAHHDAEEPEHHTPPPQALVETNSGHRPVPGSVRITFIVAAKWLLTIHDGDVPCLNHFRAQDKAETRIGLLTPQALAASLLDWHLGEYFQEVSRMEAAVDRLDERVLRETASRTLLGRIVAMRRRVSKLRALLVAHRDVFYGLSRPDFALVTESGAESFYQALAGRFERALDEVERTRDVVVGSFELFTSRTGQQTNDLVKILTFLTAVVGFCAAVAGLLGMNFQLSIFKTGDVGFTIVTGSLLLLALLSVLVARIRRWI